MEHYDGPVYRTDGEQVTPPSQPSKRVNDDNQPTYHSVDPMAQFVTPRSTVSKQSRVVIDYSAIRRQFRRIDAQVYLLADDVDGNQVTMENAAAQTATLQPAQAQVEVPASDSLPNADQAAESPVTEKPASITPPQKLEQVDAPVVPVDILTTAADAEENAHIPATLTELAAQGRMQARQKDTKKINQRRQAQKVARAANAGVRPNRFNIHGAYARFKSEQAGHH